MCLKGMKLVEIASQLNLPEGTVRSWKNRYKWDCNVAKEKRNVAKAKKGGQPGNKNAVGGKGGGGRPDMAQGGGPDGSKLQAALDAVTAAVRDAKA